MLLLDAVLRGLLHNALYISPTLYSAPPDGHLLLSLRCDGGIWRRMTTMVCRRHSYSARMIS